MEYIYRVLREWLERNKSTAFTKEEIAQLTALIKRQAE